MKYYIDRDIAINEHRIYLWGIDLPPEDIKSSYIEYIGDSLPAGYLGKVSVVDDTVMPATIYDMYTWGLYKLGIGETFNSDFELIVSTAPSDKYYWSGDTWLVDDALLEEGEKNVNNEIVTINKPSKLYVWNKETYSWDYDPDQYELQIGEKIVDKEIVTVPITEGMEFPYWNRVDFVWENNIPTNELITNTTTALVNNELQMIAYERLDMDCTSLLETKVTLLAKLDELKASKEAINVIGG